MTPARPASGRLAGEPGPVMRWVAGARPRTLPAAVVPVVVGTAAARPWTGAWSGCPSGLYWRALAALVVALAIQVGTNYANDYSDGVRGTDEVRVGPFRLTASKLVAATRVRDAAYDFVLDNSGTLEDLYASVDEIVRTCSDPAWSGKAWSPDLVLETVQEGYVP